MKPRPLTQRIDIPTTVMLILLVAIGLLTIYSSTYQSGSTMIRGHFYRQLACMGLGLGFMITAMLVPMRYFYALSYPIYGLAVALLIGVLVFGETQGGAGRWIRILGIQFQPSEPAKLATVLAMARFLADSKYGESSLKNVMAALVFLGIPLVLVQQQPDLGTCLVFLALLVPMLFWAGMSGPIVFLLIAPLFSMLTASVPHMYLFLAWMLVISIVLYVARQGIFMTLVYYAINISVGVMTPYLWSKLKPYQQKRILTFLNPHLDPKGAGYQILQSQTAIGSGGLTGKGYLQGTQTHLRFLPEQHTDFAFSVVGEEFGFLGAITVLGLFFALIMRGLHTAATAKNGFASLVAVGICTVFLVHVIVNVGVTVGLLPVTGLPLPFLSYGGTSLVVSMTMVGILANITVNRLEY